DHASLRAGLIYGIGAYSWWGLIAIYFKLVKHVPATYVLAHRIVWSVVFLMILVIAQRRWTEIIRCLRTPRIVLVLAGSTTALAINWLTFIWAVSHNFVVQASLGYFITPLVSVLMGFVFLKERLRPWQAVGLAIAAFGVVKMVMGGHGLPWIALALAL